MHTLPKLNGDLEQLPRLLRKHTRKTRDYKKKLESTIFQHKERQVVCVEKKKNVFQSKTTARTRVSDIHKTKTSETEMK